MAGRGPRKAPQPQGLSILARGAAGSHPGAHAAPSKRQCQHVCPSDQRGDLRASWVQSRVRSVHHACRRGLRLPTPLSRRERPAEPLRKHLPGVDALGPGRPGGAGRAAALGDARSPWTAGHCPPAGRAVSLCADPGRPPGCQKQLPRVTARNARGDSCIRAPLMGRDRQARPSPRPTS